MKKVKIEVPVWQGPFYFLNALMTMMAIGFAFTNVPLMTKNIIIQLPFVIIGIAILIFAFYISIRTMKALVEEDENETTGTSK